MAAQPAEMQQAGHGRVPSECAKLSAECALIYMTGLEDRYGD